MDYCWKCGGPMSKNSKERVCKNCGRTVQRHKDRKSNDSISDSLGDILAAYMAVSAAEEQEQARIRRENRRIWIKQHRKELTVTVLVFLIAILIFVASIEIRLLIPIGYDSNSLEGLKYTEVVQLLKESGFTNVRVKEIADLTISREDEENRVTEVKLAYTDRFRASTKYPSNLRVTVVYHTVEVYAPPLTSKDAKGMNYESVIEEFENIGFTDININVEYDIITGWINNDGEVKSITINGDRKYDYSDQYRLDAEIVITYHSLRTNKPD